MSITETFGRKIIAAERGPFGRNNLFRWLPLDLFRPKWALSAAILLWPKVSVTAAIRLGPCGRNTVASVRPKTPFGRSLLLNLRDPALELSLAVATPRGGWYCQSPFEGPVYS